MDFNVIPSRLVFFSAFFDRSDNNDGGVLRSFCRHFRSSPSDPSAVWSLAPWPTHACRELSHGLGSLFVNLLLFLITSGAPLIAQNPSVVTSEWWSIISIKHNDVALKLV